MYVPDSFSCTDEEALFGLIERYSFASLIVPGDPGTLPDVAHLPFHLDRERRVLQGHVARANPIWERFVGGGPALVVFAGPHGYVSPSWYTSRDQVPTWNYAVVHVEGTGQLLPEAALGAMLRTLVEDNERGASRAATWSIDELTPETYERLSQAIVGFEVAIERLVGKFKLSQNRKPDDRDGVLRALDARGLAGSAEDVALASFMRTHGRPPNG
jgi:transcriptional regulator